MKPFFHKLVLLEPEKQANKKHKKTIRLISYIIIKWDDFQNCQVILMVLINGCKSHLSGFNYNILPLSIIISC
jgi:hypothetical protein